VVAEALACGLPVMLADPVNISREVAEAGAGLVHTDTVSGTSAALRQWLNSSTTERTAMGHRASTLFFERFDSASVALNQLEAFSLHLSSSI
jgi:glycosyltransferase involved in cell wall biosynthesis